MSPDYLIWQDRAQQCFTPLKFLDCVFQARQFRSAMSSTKLSSGIFHRIVNQQGRYSKGLWFGLSLTLAVVYSVLLLQQSFGGDYIVQDDARQHVFWTQRYVDSDLFPEDLIADYFQAIAPVGYAWLYKIAANLGIDPIVFSKVLPPILGIITVGYGFWLCLEIFPVPLAGFISSVILSQTLWASDEISSGTPRAFLYPLLIVFLYYFLRGHRYVCLLLVCLQASFYPQIALIAIGLMTVRLLSYKKGKLSFSQEWKDYFLLSLCICLFLGIVLSTRDVSAFGNVVSRSEAVNMVEFQPNGRNAFFRSGLDYWIKGSRSGIFHPRTSLPLTILAGILLPLLTWRSIKNDIANRIRPSIAILWQLLLVSFGWFFLAHLLLFKLHLPSRYTSHTIRIILTLSAAISWTILLNIIVCKFQQWRKLLQSKRTLLCQTIAILSNLFLGSLLFAFLIVLVFYYPVVIQNFPKSGYINRESASHLYDFFSARSKDSMIVSLSGEAGNIPTFAARSVLSSSEHSLAYHTEYYGELRQRVENLIEAQYSAEPSRIRTFIDTYKVNFWLLDKDAFNPDYLSNNRWRRQFQPSVQEATLALEQGIEPVLKASIPRCTVLDTSSWLVLDADCIDQFARHQSQPE